ncbi:MAG TPA: ATP-binding protein [Acetobacteraceae bacterium]|nr:ATP-binding protein [Acetobacteraceae bacterium]
MQAGSIEEAANRKNLLLLVALRWVAVGGQIATILFVRLWLGIPLPLEPMGCVILFLVGLNLASLYRCRSRGAIAGGEIFAGLLMDVGALTVQLYLSGGAMNPFVSLFLLQVILGAVLLRPLLVWILVAVTSACFIGLTGFYRALDLSAYAHGPLHGEPSFFELHIYGMIICFLLAAILLVLFVARINDNLRDRDRRLAEIREQSVEEEHIVRMGLLASGAAHELGTPLATLSVILNDWERVPALNVDPEVAAEIEEMNAALARCKEIVSRVLLAAGEARSEEAEPTTLLAFLDHVVAGWRETRAPAHLDYAAEIGADAAIASDTVIRQILFNVFDNALEASPGWVGIRAAREGEFLVVTVRDRGRGFAPEILANLGKPYQSTKNRAGSGLGLFLVVNVLRKLGGAIAARNPPEGGAEVEIRLPIAALAIEGEARHGYIAAEA